MIKIGNINSLSGGGGFTFSATWAVLGLGVGDLVNGFLPVLQISVPYKAACHQSRYDISMRDRGNAEYRETFDIMRSAYAAARMVSVPYYSSTMTFTDLTTIQSMVSSMSSQWASVGEPRRYGRDSYIEARNRNEWVIESGRSRYSYYRNKIATMSVTESIIKPRSVVARRLIEQGYSCSMIRGGHQR